MEKSKLDRLTRDTPVAYLRLTGSAQAALDFIAVLVNTEPIETDPNWWEVRLLILYRN